MGTTNLLRMLCQHRHVRPWDANDNLELERLPPKWGFDDQHLFARLPFNLEKRLLCTENSILLSLGIYKVGNTNKMFSQLPRLDLEKLIRQQPDLAEFVSQ